MEPPEQIDASSGADYLEVISKAVFQSGMSWAIVNNKWNGFREAFCCLLYTSPSPRDRS